MSDKRERNAEKSKQIILDAAEEQFALKGYYGARIDEIAEIAGLNKRMIYEYFINKEELYKTVLFTVYKRMEAAEQQLIEKAHTGVELIREWISMYFEFLHNNPGFVAILMWENLNKAQQLNEMPSENVERPTIQVLAEEISRGKQSGIFRQNVDEKQVVISLITVCYANFSNSYTLSKLFHCNLNSLEMIETRKQHTIDIMLAYLQA